MFLTIVTRTCQRPKFLSDNIASVKAQTCHDLEQIFIVDHERQGLKAANQSLALNKDRVEGDYVYLLDDDCTLVNDSFVELVEDIVDSISQLDVGTELPDIIMVKSRRPSLPPSRRPIVPTVWGGTLKHGTTNGLCFVMKSALWKATIERFGGGHGGDWRFLKAALSTSPSIYWLDEIVADARQKGRGVLFETNSKDWFKPVAIEHNLEEVKEADWRLRLWMND